MDLIHSVYFWRAIGTRLVAARHCLANQRALLPMGLYCHCPTYFPENPIATVCLYMHDKIVSASHGHCMVEKCLSWQSIMFFLEMRLSPISQCHGCSWYDNIIIT